MDHPEDHPACALGGTERRQAQVNSDTKNNRLQQLLAVDPRPKNAARLESVVTGHLAYPMRPEAAEAPWNKTACCRSHLCLISTTFPPNTDGGDWEMRFAVALAADFTDTRVSCQTLPTGETSLRLFALRGR